nr:uncharacterized protein LOC117984048 [Maniola hyperantus]
MQFSFSFMISIILHTLNASYLNYEDGTSVETQRLDYQEFEPVTLYSRNLDNVSAKNINCDDFSSYAANCTIEAALIYNSSRMSPPPTTKIDYWCKAIRHLTNCAIDWNTDCKDVTESHFNEESVKGHIHVVNNICDDDWFLIRYEDLPGCIESTTDSWEACYSIFKDAVEEQKNSTHEWTHYKVHFHLCCARANFRRCTLESVFQNTNCTQEQAVTLQKFSVIVSEGAVYQDCDHNMMYSNCPGDDPRPSRTQLKRLMTTDVSRTTTLQHSLRIAIYMQAIIVFLLIHFL